MPMLAPPPFLFPAGVVGLPSPVGAGGDLAPGNTVSVAGRAFRVGKSLGRGSFGQVVEVTDKRSNAIFALKEMLCAGLMCVQMQFEVEAMQKLGMLGCVGRAPQVVPLISFVRH